MRNWADDFNTYADACRFYGADTPASLEVEAEHHEASETAASLDAMEARGGPAYSFKPEIPF